MDSHHTLSNRDDPSKPLIVVNVHAVQKLTPTTYLTWKTQVEALLIGYDLYSFIDGSNPMPSKTITKDATIESNPAYLSWLRQDKLLFGALAGTLSPTLGPLIIRTTTTKEAWDILANTYAKPSRGHIKQLKAQLNNISKGSLSIEDFMAKIKRTVNELALLGTHIPQEDVTDRILEGLDDNYNDIITAVLARDSAISFEELNEKLITKELRLGNTSNPTYTENFPATANPTHTRWNNNRNTTSSPSTKITSSHPPKHFKPFEGKCQWCNVRGHVLAYCPTFKDLHPTIAMPPRGNRTITQPQAHVATAQATSSSSPNPGWLLDSGASHHITTDLANLSLHSPYDGTDEIVIGDGSGLPISHTGSTLLPSPSHSFKLSNVLCAPSMHKNIISIRQFCHDNHVTIEFSSSFFYVKEPDSGVILFQGPTKDGVYEWPKSLPLSPQVYHTTKNVDWHHRLGHPSKSILQQIISHLEVISPMSYSHCNSCFINKSHKLPFGLSTLTTSSPLEVIFSDVWSSPIYSFDNFKYYVVFVDHYTKYVWLYPMKKKSDTSLLFPKFKALVENFFNTKIKTLFSDNGGEYEKLTSYLAAHGITHLTSPPHTPEHNGYAERRHRHIVETSLALLTHASMPLKYWSYAILTSVYLINRMPTPTLDNQSPYQKLFHSPPKYTHLHNFGCLCYPWLRPYAPHKLAPKSIACVFLGYSSTQHAYLCLDPLTHRIYSSRHVRFVEDTYPFSKSHASAPLTTTIVDDWCSFHITTISTPPTPPLQPHPPTTPPLHHSPTPSPPTSPPTSPHLSSTPVTTTHSTPTAPPAPNTIITRAKNNIYKPITKLNLAVALQPTEPKSVKHALSDPAWHAAMQAQYKALLDNGTWELVPPSSAQNLVGCKWVFRVKYTKDRTVERLKARLVAKGFHQRPGLDYSETFSPVIKQSTVRLLLTLATINGWRLRQLDINDAFLQGTLTDNVYMAQPQGFIDQQKPHHVCRLRKAIYGLKQAPRAWYTELRTYLLTAGFTNSVMDTSLFFTDGTHTPIYVLVYVDDIIVTGPCSLTVSKFITNLAIRFSLKDLGDLDYFLGVEVQQCSHGLFLSQRKYIADLLDRAAMSDCKPVSSPLDINVKLTLGAGTALDNPTEYRTLVGGLQYLSLTRLDITFAVNKLSQFMHKPTTVHHQALKRLLRYLHGTLDLGLNIYSNSPLHLHAYSDADWAGDRDDFISTGGYIVYLGKNPISWNSKKQKSVARSSTEAEYRCVAQTAAELDWMRHIMRELKVPCTNMPIIYCDNIGATKLSANPVFQSRMKHLGVDYHFIRERVQSGLLRVTSVANDDQLADALTKPLPRCRLKMLLAKIGLSLRSSILRGHDRNIQIIS